MKILLTMFLSAILSISIAGCQNMTKQDVGTVTGGALGALVGSRFGGGSGRSVAIALGAITGAVIGGQVGKSMDKVDQMKVDKTLEKNRSGKTSSWRNPDTGNLYSVTPRRTYRKHNGKYCREYITKATIAGKTQTMYGTACRQSDGQWKTGK